MVSVQQGGDAQAGQEGWLAAGLAAGQAAVTDARSGLLCAFWQAHEGGLSALACVGQHMLVTAGLQVRGCSVLPGCLARQLAACLSAFVVIGKTP